MKVAEGETRSIDRFAHTFLPSGAILTTTFGGLLPMTGVAKIEPSIAALATSGNPAAPLK